jgi:type IV secretion system protein VirB10
MSQTNSNNNTNPANQPSPGSFNPHTKPSGSKSRRPWNIIVGVIIGIGLVLFLSLINDAGKEEKEQQQKQTTEVESKGFLPGEEASRGLATTPNGDKPEQVQPDTSPVPSSLLGEQNEQIIVVGPPPVDPEEEARKREEADERRRRKEAHYAALSSGIVVQTNRASVAVRDSSEPAEPGTSSPSPSRTMQQSSYDPEADKDKEQFFQRNETAQWMSPYTRENGHPYEIKTGSVIPGVMISGVNSDLPGNLIAQVSQNVFDSATGRYLLIPQGAKLYGVYDSRVVYGQERVLVAWNRVIFPDGSSVTLGAMPGADMSGYAGFQDKVDNHYWRIFGSAILMSLITGGAAYAMDSTNSQTASGAGTSMQDEMTSALAAQLGQTTLKLLEQNLSIKPTLGIRPGYRFNVTTTKDIVFKAPYAGIETLLRTEGKESEFGLTAATSR